MLTRVIATFMMEVLSFTGALARPRLPWHFIQDVSRDFKLQIA